MDKIHSKIPDEPEKMPLLGGASAKDLPHGLPRFPNKSPKQKSIWFRGMTVGIYREHYSGLNLSRPEGLKKGGCVRPKKGAAGLLK